MPSVYLRKDLYNEIVNQHLDVTDFVNKAVAEALKSLKEKQMRGKAGQSNKFR